MTTRDHLIHIVQEQYAFLRDFLPVVAEMRRDVRDNKVSRWLECEYTAYTDELETLDRVLNLLGARNAPTQSHLVPGATDTLRRFKELGAPSQEQLTIHAALTLFAVSQYLQGAYTGDVELARAIGEQDLALLLEENARQRAFGAKTWAKIAPAYIRQIGHAETRHAA